MTPSRRTVVGTAAAGIATLAGCSDLGSEPARLDVTVFNNTDTPYTVSLTMYDTDRAGDRSDDRVWDARDVEVPARDSREWPDAVVKRSLLVRYVLFEDGSRQTDKGHVHYVRNDVTEGITFDVEPDGQLVRRGGN